MQATKLENAQPKSKAYQIALGAGLLLEVKPTGKKSFFYRYRLGGKGYKVKMGDFPALTLEAAETMRTEYRAAVAAGTHPESRRESETTEGTFAAFVPPFLATFQPGTHKEQREQYLSRYILPKFGARGIETITAKEIFPLLESIKASRGESVALLCHGILKGVFNRAIYRGYINYNPLAVIPTKEIGRAVYRDTVLTLQELKTLMAKANDAGAVGAALRLVALTLCRKQEVIGATWQEVDFEGGVWTIPAERMKGRKAHVIPLTPLIKNELLNLCNGKPESAKGWLFPSPYKSALPLSHSALNHAIGRMVPGYTVHDLRRSGATICAENGYPAEVIEAALAHSTKGIRAHYIHATFLEQKRAMLAAYGQLLVTGAD